MKRIVYIIILFISLATHSKGQASKYLFGDPETKKLYLMHYNNGLMLMEQKEYDKAIEKFTFAIDMIGHPDAYFNRALAYLRVGSRVNFCKNMKMARMLGDKEADDIYCLKCIKKDTLYFDKLGQVTSKINSYKIESREISLFDSTISKMVYERDSLGFYLLPIYKTIRARVDNLNIVLPMFINKEIDLELLYHVPAVLREKFGSGDIGCTFHIDKTGNIYNIKMKESVKDFNKQISNSIRSTGTWSPASLNGEYVDIELSFDFKFSSTQMPINFNNQNR